MSLAEIDERIRAAIPMGFAHRSSLHPFASENSAMEALATKIGQDPQNVYRQLGTLGGGNHFIEIGEADGDWYIFIHTGSRNFGLQVCKYHAAKAKANGSKYLFGNDMKEYFDDMIVAQRFAGQNRCAIVASIMGHSALQANMSATPHTTTLISRGTLSVKGRSGRSR